MGHVSYAMRIAFLVGLLIATAACGPYRFPGGGSDTGNVHGQVLALGCGGAVQPDSAPCLATPISGCLPQPASSQGCGELPLPGFELAFTAGTSRLVTKTDSAGTYSIELPSGTWNVSGATFGRIVDGPQSLVVIAGESTTADYVVQTGIKAAA